MDGRHGALWNWVGRDRSLFFYLLIAVAFVALLWTLPRRAFGQMTMGPELPAAAEVAAPVAVEAAVVEAPAVAATAPAAMSRPAIESQAIRTERSTVEGKPATEAPLGGSMTDSLVQVAVALAVVLGLVLVGRALAKKFVPGAGVGTGRGVMEVLARQPLSRQHALVMVRIGSQVLVLAEGKDKVESVLVVGDQAEVANLLGQVQGVKATSIQNNFNALLANARMDLESGESDEAEERSLAASEARELDSELDEMAAARRQLMELREKVRAVRESVR